MPKVEAFEVLETLQQGGGVGPVLLPTAEVNLVDRVQGFRLRADDHVLRPCSQMELKPQGSAILKRAQDATLRKRDRVRTGDFASDSKKYQLDRPGLARPEPCCAVGPISPSARDPGPGGGRGGLPPPSAPGLSGASAP